MSDKFYNFHFYCLYDLLQPIEWIALSKCCKYFHKMCNPTVFKKFKTQALLRFCEDFENVSDFFYQLQHTRSIISGSFPLGVLFGESFHNDIDIFKHGNCYPLILEGRRTSDHGVYIYASNKHTNFKIEHVTSYTVGKHSTKYQVIQIMRNSDAHVRERNDNNDIDAKVSEEKKDKQEEKEKEEKKEEDKELFNEYSSTSDHVNVRLYVEKFDLDFCKVVFTPTSLEIFNIDSIINRCSNVNIMKHKMDLMKEDTNQAKLTLQNFKERMEKYTKRGFKILNLNQVLESIEESKRNEKLRIEEENKQRETNKLNQMWKSTVFDKFLSCSMHDSVSYNYQRVDHMVICEELKFLHDLPLSYENWYNIFTYADHGKLISKCFDKTKIPYHWVSHLRHGINVYFDLVYMNHKIVDCDDPLFWKYIMNEWPYHENFQNHPITKETPTTKSQIRIGFFPFQMPDFSK